MGEFGVTSGFSSAFDTFELDDGFLSKLDAEVVQNNLKVGKAKKLFPCIGEENLSENKKLYINNIEKKKGYYDLPVSISDLSGFNINKFKETDIKSHQTSESNQERVLTNCETKISSKYDVFDCVSPILGKLPTKTKPFSSTPIRKEMEQYSTKGTDQNFKNEYYCFMEADLFEDWDDIKRTEKVIEKENSSFITLSQAVKLVEDAQEEKSSTECHMKEDSNESINLLTGEVVRPEDGEKENKEKNFSSLHKFENENHTVKCRNCDSNKSNIYYKYLSNSIVKSCEKCSNINKPIAAQKLNFEKEKPSSFLCQKTLEKVEENLDVKYLDFKSDDSFDDFIQLGLAEKIQSEELKCLEEKNLKTVTLDNDVLILSEINKSLSDESFNICRKRGKIFKIEESDSADDSPAKFPINKRNKTFGKEFLESQAEVSDAVLVSSDELDVEDDEYDKSFVDENSYCTQNFKENMTAKYLQSIKTLNNRPGAFKIPKAKPYIVDNIFSQAPSEVNSEYEIDSFCVNNIEFDDKELSDLEVAELILEKERRNKKRKSKLHLRRKK